MPRIRTVVPGVDPKLLIRDAAKLFPEPSRRLFLRGAAGLGALTMLTGCNIIDSDAAESTLAKISRFNDRVQALLFNPNKLAPTYPESMVDRTFRFNGYYDEEDAPEVDGETYRLEVGGLVDDKKSWTLPELYALPQEKQVTRHVCADTRAKYIWFQCAEGYSNTIDMPTALHPQTQMSFKFADETLPRKFGYPMKIRIPTKLGFKNPKHVVAMHVTNKDLGGYWE